MRKYKDSENFGLKSGEVLTHKGKYVEVYSRKSGKRLYSLNGNFIGSIGHKEFKEACIPLDECIFIKDMSSWKLLSYEGEKICESISKIDFLRNFPEYMVLYKFRGQIAIYSVAGECILEFGNYGELISARKNICLFKDITGKIKVFDLKEKKFLQDSFEECISTLGGYYLKNSGGYNFLNEETAKIEFQVDAFYFVDFYKNRNVIGGSFGFDELYKNGHCGIVAKYHPWYNKSKYIVKIILPIEYKKIEFNENGIKAYKEDEITTYSYSAIYNKYFAEEYSEKEDKTTQEDKNIEIKVFGSTVKFGETVYMFDKFLAIEDPNRNLTPCKCFSLNGTYLGNAGLIDDGENPAFPNIVATESWIAMGINSSGGCFGENWGNWIIHSYDGKAVVRKTFNNYEIYGNYYVFSYNLNYKVDSSRNNYIAVFTMKGELVLTLNNIKGVEPKESYIKVIDFDDRVWIYNLKGKLVIKEGFDQKQVTEIEDTIWVKQPSGYVMYNCLTGQKYQQKVDEIYKVDIYDSKLYKIHYQDHFGIYMYTGDFSVKSNIVGFKEIVPIKYNVIETKVDYSKFNLFRALKDDCEEIYDLDGNLIATTES